MVRILVHPEARPWAPRLEDQRKIQAFFGPKLDHAVVKILPRQVADQELGKKLPPYSFRAFTRGPTSTVFVDATETPESVAFLVAHELAHQVVDTSPVLDQAFQDARVQTSEPWSDRFHERDAEERFCDGVAGRLLGTWYDRTWWRGRTRRISGSEQFGQFRLLTRRRPPDRFRFR